MWSLSIPVMMRILDLWSIAIHKTVNCNPQDNMQWVWLHGLCCRYCFSPIEHLFNLIYSVFICSHQMQCLSWYNKKPLHVLKYINRNPQDKMQWGWLHQLGSRYCSFFNWTLDFIYIRVFYPTMYIYKLCTFCNHMNHSCNWRSTQWLKIDNNHITNI